MTTRSRTTTRRTMPATANRNTALTSHVMDSRRRKRGPEQGGREQSRDPRGGPRRQVETSRERRKRRDEEPMSGPVHRESDIGRRADHEVDGTQHRREGFLPVADCRRSGPRRPSTQRIPGRSGRTPLRRASTGRPSRTDRSSSHPARRVLRLLAGRRPRGGPTPRSPRCRRRRTPPMRAQLLVPFARAYRPEVERPHRRSAPTATVTVVDPSQPENQRTPAWSPSRRLRCRPASGPWRRSPRGCQVTAQRVGVDVLDVELELALPGQGVAAGHLREPGQARVAPRAGGPARPCRAAGTA